MIRDGKIAVTQPFDTSLNLTCRSLRGWDAQNRRLAGKS